MRRHAPLWLVLLLVPAASAAVGDPPFDLEASRTEATVEPQRTATFPVTFASRSSEPLRLVFEVARNDRGLDAILPRPLLLGAEGERDGRADVTFVLQSPYETGRMDETAIVTYRITPHHPEQELIVGESRTLELTLRTVGTYVPGPQMFGVLLALGVAALALRRRA